MGICGSKNMSPEDRLAAERSRKIDNENEEDFDKELEKIKLLLLGAGESGKSTVIKQMRVLYGADYTDEEKVGFRLSIHQNIIETMEQLCMALTEMLPNDSLIHSNAFKMIRLPEGTSTAHRIFPELTEEYVSAIKTLWNSASFKTIWSKRSQLQVIESTAIFLDRIDQVTEFGYQPDTNDIILSRARTSGIREERLKIDNQIFCFFDVGGQRNERRKWINCFDGVHGIIFVAALSEFDQKLWEESSVNRMTEALHLFESTIVDEAFRRAAIILFLNKIDLFREKVKNVNIADVPDFSDYSGPPRDPEKGVEYFVNKFLQKNTTHEKIYWHVTCATDTGSISVVFNACKEIVITNALKDQGFVS